MSMPLTLAGFCDPYGLAGLPDDTPIAVALSGGADSVALLLSLKDRTGVVALHVHHGMRGEEADRDAAFCRTLTERLGVPLHILFVDVPARVRETGESPETAARAARYEALTAWLTAHKIPLLATAHHADDQLETMLQHLLRGSGTRGLGGIPACRALAEGVFVVRPMLLVTKEEILAFLVAKGQDFVTDSTNGEPCCQRNLLRQRVLPLLKELQPSAAALAARCAAALAEDEAYLDSLAADFIDGSAGKLQADALSRLPQPIFVRVMRRLLPEVPTAKQLAAIRALLAENAAHAALSLGGGIRLSLDRGTVTLAKEARTPAPDYDVALVPGENRIDAASAAVYLLPLDAPPPMEASAYRFTATAKLCSAAIKGTLRARPRRAGDVIFHGGMHKAVRKLAAISHLSPAHRARMPLLTDGEGVLAVPFGATRDGAAKKPDLTVYFCFD